MLAPKVVKLLPTIFVNLVGGPDVVIPEGFLPFGPAYGDSALRDVDDGSSTEIQLGSDVVIFGAHSNRLYVSINCRSDNQFCHSLSSSTQKSYTSMSRRHSRYSKCVGNGEN